MGTSKKGSLEKKVIAIYPYAVDISSFLKAPVHSNLIANEVPAPEPSRCFLGSYYRKVVSSKDLWVGIEGIITLGEFIPDLKRYQTDTRIGVTRYLDNPSIYMGGLSLTESDAGLSMGVSYLDGDLSKELDASSPKIAYIPFWRYIYDKIDHVGQKVDRIYINSWNNIDPRSVEFYYFPGDKIKMQVFSPLPNYLQLRIELLEPTINPKYQKIRASYPKQPQVFLSPIFYSEGHGTQLAEFKRVNAIDQYGNEGSVAQKTNAMVTKAVWHDVYLFRNIDGKIVKVPFDKKRQVSMICPNKELIEVEYQGLSGESITIQPGKVKGDD